MYELGFKHVCYSTSVLINGEEVSMSHCPLPGIKREDLSNIDKADKTESWHGEKKNKLFTVENRGQFHLHGRIHSNPEDKRKSTKTLGKQYDVGMPANNYTPVSFSTIESWISLYKKGQYVK